jgi:fructose-1,6-bisphosphatase I
MFILKGISPFVSIDKAFSTSGRSLVAAGYSVYSSSTELVISLGPSGSLGACGFTLDVITKEWILTRENLACPQQGGYYSLNEGREPDWPQGLRKWVNDAKRGQTPSGTTYSSRYICSLCADVHRTIIKGGWAGNPRPHLRLLYEAAPLSHVIEACGGRGSDGTQDLLDIVPESLHHRISVFIGSKNDIDELESYGNTRQNAKSYTQ